VALSAVTESPRVWSMHTGILERYIYRSSSDFRARMRIWASRSLTKAGSKSTLQSSYRKRLTWSEKSSLNFSVPVETFSLFELNEHIRRVIALNFQDSLWVKAEIAQVRQSRGHYYLELIEKAPSSDEIVAQIPAVIWSKNAWIIQRKLRDVFSQILQDGMEIRLKVRVDFHERFGLKLMIEDLDPSYTLGNIEARRREIIATLYAEGL